MRAFPGCGELCQDLRIKNEGQQQTKNESILVSKQFFVCISFEPFIFSVRTKQK